VSASQGTGERVEPNRDTRVPHLYLVAARALFPDEATWLDAIARVGAALAALRSHTEIAKLHIALQVRIEVAAEAAALAPRALEVIRRTWAAIPVYLNAEADAAALVFDGIHWPERRIPTGAPRTHLPCAASVHSLASLRSAEAAGACFAVFGAIWTPSWKQDAARGVAGLGALTAQARIPVLAIGGITARRASACMQAGAAGIAVASGVFTADEPAQALVTYADVLSSAKSPPAMS